MTVSTEELVGLKEISERLGARIQKVWGWKDSKTMGFPEPVVTLKMGPVWRWADVEAWWKDRQSGKE